MDVVINVQKNIHVMASESNRNGIVWYGKC